MPNTAQADRQVPHRRRPDRRCRRPGCGRTQRHRPSSPGSKTTSSRLPRSGPRGRCRGDHRRDRESPEPVTIISIGPSQTVAAALDRRPEIARKAFFVGMQGSVFTVTAAARSRRSGMSRPTWRRPRRCSPRPGSSIYDHALGHLRTRSLFPARVFKNSSRATTAWCGRCWRTTASGPRRSESAT